MPVMFLLDFSYCVARQFQYNYFTVDTNFAQELLKTLEAKTMLLKYKLNLFFFFQF